MPKNNDEQMKNITRIFTNELQTIFFSLISFLGVILEILLCLQLLIPPMGGKGIAPFPLLATSPGVTVKLYLPDNL